jgi:hypothetical protein
MALERLAPAARPPSLPAGQPPWRRRVPQLVTPAADRPLPHACGLGHRLHPAVPPFEGFAGCPVPTSALIELRHKTGEVSSQDCSNATVYQVTNVLRMHKIGQLFIYDDLRLDSQGHKITY